MSTKEDFDKAISLLAQYDDLPNTRARIEQHESALQQRIAELEKREGATELFDHTQVAEKMKPLLECIAELEAKCAEQGKELVVMKRDYHKLFDECAQLEAFKAKVMGSPKVWVAWDGIWFYEISNEYDVCRESVRVPGLKVDQIYAVPCDSIEEKNQWQS